MLVARFWKASLLEPVELLLMEVDVSAADCSDEPEIVMSGVDEEGPVAMAAEATTLRAKKARVFMTSPSTGWINTGPPRRFQGLHGRVGTSALVALEGCEKHRGLLSGCSVCGQRPAANTSHALPITVESFSTDCGGRPRHCSLQALSKLIGPINTLVVTNCEICKICAMLYAQ